MPQTYDLILKNGRVFTPGGLAETSIGVRDGKIAAIGAAGDAGEVIDCGGLVVLPGAIDTQVHLREPGLEQKEDLESRSSAPVLGGITGVFEIPTTQPHTTTADAQTDTLNPA